MIRFAMAASFAQIIRRDIRSKGPSKRQSAGFSIYVVKKKELISTRGSLNAPSTSISTPPASLTMTAPAAMSQQWIPISKKASTAPVATRHMLVAAVPDPRSLSGRAKRIIQAILRQDKGRSGGRGRYPCTGMQRIFRMVLKILLTTSGRLSVPCSEMIMDFLISARKARPDRNYAPSGLITDATT